MDWYLLPLRKKGAYAAVDPPRGAMKDKLHPLYKNIIKEYYTDGRYYFSADGKQKFNADVYYKTIEADINESANKLPLTVFGEVAWGVVQTSPTHLRHTIIDGGYTNPSVKTAKIAFHTVKPVKIVDLLDGKNSIISDPLNVTVDVSCGLFRFIDIGIDKSLE